MSNFLYMERGMSSEEKLTWISALVGVVPVGYLAAVLPKLPGTDVARIA